MKKYLQYLKYLFIHKKNIFMVCWRRGLYLHALTHDLSKFYPSEIISYTHHFYGNEKEKKQANFGSAYLRHKNRNKHHSAYWVHANGEAEYMPVRYIQQMICDWEAMSIEFDNDPYEWYLANKEKIILHPQSRAYVEAMLTGKLVCKKKDN